jgi:ATP-dependent Clp protease protease subunit
MWQFVRLNGKEISMSSKLDTLFDFNIDLKRRLIFLSGDIDKKRTDAVIKSLILLGKNFNDRITLIIQSFGGDIYDTFAIYDVMKGLQCPLRTISIGKCQSAALLLVAAGTKGQRFSTPNCCFMTHEMLVDSGESSMSDLVKETAYLQKLDKQFTGIISKHSLLNSEEWEKIHFRKGDVYFDANEALKFGIIDKVASVDNFWETL